MLDFIPLLKSDFFKRIESCFRFNVDLSKTSWMRCGGLAKCVFNVKNIEDLKFFLANFPYKEQIFVLGAKSNVIIRDEGINGVVVRLSGDFAKMCIIENLQEYILTNKVNESHIHYNSQDCDSHNQYIDHKIQENNLIFQQKIDSHNNTLSCKKDLRNIDNKNNIFVKFGGGTLDSVATDFCIENSIGGLEFLSGIPGTIGGNLRSNAGCYEKQISDVMEIFQAIDLQGQEHIFFTSDVKFSYRNNPLPRDLIFTFAILRGQKDDSVEIKRKVASLLAKRENSQPIRERTSGSTFINPENTNAWKLIDESGLRGFTVGGAMFSEKHCNFIINKNNATSEDIECLLNLAKSRVKEKFNIDLKQEVDIIG